MTAIHSEEVAPLNVLTDQLRLLLRSSQSPNQMSVMVVEVPPGGGVPPHSHQEEEGYFVLEGELALMIDGRDHPLGPNGFGHVPPGTVHGYTNAGNRPVRFVAWIIGGPLDDFFEQMNRRVHRMPEDAGVMMELTQRYGIRMSGAAPAG